ncbi:MAG TPA: DUF3307 domain-containing protein [Paracoccaceae bacterium]|nr:DUF3307 domain-containing protein [Paracoccaceae bacterium]
MALLIMLGLAIKHFVADFLLQFNWMITAKGRFDKIGGYAHAGVHGVGSGLCFWLLGFPVVLVAGMAVGDFVIHYAVDFTKARASVNVERDRQIHLYWGMYGLDQLAHYLTYIGMAYVAIKLA